MVSCLRPFISDDNGKSCVRGEPVPRHIYFCYFMGLLKQSGHNFLNNEPCGIQKLCYLFVAVESSVLVEGSEGKTRRKASTSVAKIILPSPSNQVSYAGTRAPKGDSPDPCSLFQVPIVDIDFLAQHLPVTDDS